MSMQSTRREKYEITDVHVGQEKRLEKHRRTIFMIWKMVMMMTTGYG